jgi:competence protein ComEC
MRPVVRALVCALLVVLAGCSGSGVVPTDGPGSAAPTDASDPAADATPLPADAEGTLTVRFLAVGQGDATLVVSPAGETMLVDTGDYADDGRYVLDALERHGIDRIDHLVTTHADADHVGGHAAVIEHLETEGEGVGAVYDPGIVASTRTYEAYLDAVERHDVPLYRTRAGDDLPLAGVETAVLAPPEEALAGRDRNENSLVLRLAYGERSVLLTGDVEAAAEGWLLDRYDGALDATVLKVGHHGSSSSTSDAFLGAVSPAVAVVSSAYDSEYGHPHEEVLARLADRSVPTFWTGTHGDVVVRTDGRRLTVATQRAAPTDATALRSGGAADPESSAAVAPRLSVGASVGGGGGGGGAPSTAADTAPDDPALRVVEVNADAAGPDGENLNDEYVVFENAGDDPLDLAGWTVSDEAGHEYTFGDVTLAPGDRLTLHTGTGTDTATDVYWGSEAPYWNNDGDTVRVETANGSRVLTEPYE